MKVLCINAALNADEFPYGKGFKLVEGEVYTVIGEYPAYNTIHQRVGTCYSLYEEPNRDNLYPKDKFIPVSEINEVNYALKKPMEQLIETFTFLK